MAGNTDRRCDINESGDRKHDDDGSHNNAEEEEEKMIHLNLEAEHELHIQVGKNSDVKIELEYDEAEVHGTEMELNKEYCLKPYSSIGVFTWSGCDLTVCGTVKAMLYGNEAPMILNVILHASLEERRLRAVAENKKGPVVLVVGQNDVSKIQLCRLLLNYAVRMGHNPLFVDIDVGQNFLSFPSTIGVLPVKKPADIVNGFDDHPVEIYHYGSRSAWQSIVAYSLLLRRLSQILRSGMMQMNENVKTSGVIINGCDWSESEIRHHGYGTVTLAAEIFEIDVLCVLHDEPLYNHLKGIMPEGVEVIFIPAIGSVVEKRRRADKRESRLARINEYFYGPSNQPRQPFKFEVKTSDVQIFEVWAKSVPRNIEFFGNIKETDVKLERVSISHELIDVILSLSSADDVQDDIMYMPVIGFICVTDVDIERQVITVISRQPGPLSKKILLMGDTKMRKFQGGKKEVTRIENSEDNVTESENEVKKTENYED